MGLLKRGNTDWADRPVRDATGERVGSVAEVLYEDGFPTTLVIDVGEVQGLRGRTVSVPVEGIRFASGGLRLPVTRERIDEIDELQPGDDPGRLALGRFGPAAGTAAEVVLHEERLEADVQPVPTERVRLVKRVVTEERTVTVTLHREVLEVVTDAYTPRETEPAEWPSPVAGTEEIILVREEPLVGTRAVPYERVRLVKELVEEPMVVSGTVQREEAEVTRGPA